MWIPLVVLAFFATVGGFVGVSKAFTGGHHVGGRLNIVNWLNPIVETQGHKEKPTTDNGQRATDSHGFNLAHTIEEKLHSHTLTEILFIAISLIVAVGGIGLGWFVYAKKPSLADDWSTRLSPIYRASLNKYWVDELYGLLFTRRTMDASRGVYAVDSKIVDGAVNGAAWFTRLTSRLTGGSDKYFVDGLVNAVGDLVTRLAAPVIRAAQTGLVQNYALLMVIGLLIAVALLFGKDILRALSVVSGQ
jgi:NADH:ubiquinone oxidoreductase subunit 5 (subunit L)/multisubunit Na+/H+ antiporter MnhA subunit